MWPAVPMMIECIGRWLRGYRTFRSYRSYLLLGPISLVLFHNLKIDPLSGEAVLLFCQRVSDDDLENVFARGHLGAQLECPRHRESLQIGLITSVVRNFFSGKDLLTIKKNSYLSQQLRLSSRFINLCVI